MKETLSKELESLQEKASATGADCAELQKEVKKLEKAAHYRTSFYQKNKAEIIKYREDLKQFAGELSERIEVSAVVNAVLDKVETTSAMDDMVGKVEASNVERVVTQRADPQENTSYFRMACDVLVALWQKICDVWVALVSSVSEVKTKVSGYVSSFFGGSAGEVIDVDNAEINANADNDVAAYNESDETIALNLNA